MKEKIVQLLFFISDNKEDIQEIHQHGDEYYFRFRSRSFSINSHRDGNSNTFFVYPRWTGPFEDLAEGLEHSADTGDYTYLFLNKSDFPSGSNSNAIKEMWDWLQSKFLGLDDLMRDVGLE